MELKYPYGGHNFLPDSRSLPATILWNCNQQEEDHSPFLKWVEYLGELLDWHNLQAIQSKWMNGTQIDGSPRGVTAMTVVGGM